MQTEVGTTNTQSGSEEPSSSDLIDKANKAAERLEAGNKELAKLIAIQQQIQLKNASDGHSTAGVKQQSEEDKNIEEARKLLEGTGLEDYAFPPPKP